MASVLCSQGLVLATAMAVSGTVILLVLRLQKSFPAPVLPLEQPSSLRQQAVLRSSISYDGKKKTKKNKRVHFAEDVVMDSRQEFRRQHGAIVKLSKNSSSSPQKFNTSSGGGRGGRDGGKGRGIPANRVALYNGILRDRLVHRLAYYC